MNIFAVNNSPIIAAQELCDKHIVKQGLESCQMLCNVFEVAPYKRTHYNHPCSKWVRDTIKNYDWLIEHCREIFKEYTRRYGRIHKSQAVLEWILNNYSSVNLPSMPQTPHFQCMPVEYKQNDFVKAYQTFYIKDKTFAKWKMGNIPVWFVKT